MLFTLLISLDDYNICTQELSKIGCMSNNGLSKSFMRGWLYSCLQLQTKKNPKNYIISIRNREYIIDFICNICREFDITHWMFDGYIKDIYDIHLKGSKVDINYLLLSRENNYEFIIGFISGTFDIKGKIIYTDGWNNKKRREYYVEIVSSKEELAYNIWTYLTKELGIEAKYIKGDKIYRVRIYKKKSIIILSSLQFIDKTPLISFSDRLSNLLKKIS